MSMVSSEVQHTRRLQVLVREVRCGDGIAARELKVFCHRRQACIAVQHCTSCQYCEGFSLDPSGRRSTLECNWQGTIDSSALDSLDSGKSTADRTPVSAIMTKDVLCVTDDLSVEELTRLFLDRGISGVPVINDTGRAVGVVSKTDLVRQSYEEPESVEDDRGAALRVCSDSGVQYELEPGFHDVELSRLLVRDIMTPVAYTLKASTSVSQAAALMAFEGIHRLPITSTHGGEIVGLLSALDVLRWMGEQDAYLRQRNGEDDNVALD